MATSIVNNMQKDHPERTFIRQGAEAKLYRGFFYGRPCYSKERFSKSYRHPSLDKYLTIQRLKAELRAINRCRSLGMITYNLRTLPHAREDMRGRCPVEPKYQ